MRSLGQAKPANRLELNDDGSARRKYDAEETDDKKVILKSTIGLVIVNALVLVKNVLFGAEPAAAASPTASGQQAPQQSPSDADALSDQEPVEQGDGPADQPDDLEANDHVGSGTRFGLVTTPPVDIDPDLAPIRYRGGSGRIASSNDNESLYGARPGHGIGLHGDSIASTPRHSGSHPHHGGGHGGGGSGEDNSGHSGSNPGDHHNDDDDEDDDSNQGPGSGSHNPDPPRQTNRLPIVLAPLILGSLLADQARALTMGDLLVNASDPDGDTLIVRDLIASSGKIVANDHGGWTFTPDEGDTSAVTFTYRISDGKDSITQHASLDLLPRPAQPVITGTSGHDQLVGTPGHDVMDGLDGDDLIYGREGNDVIYGSNGNDRLVGGAGDDVIYGGDGDDVIFGNDGNDVLKGGAGKDVIDGGSGDDTISGDADNDILSGGADNDLVSGGDGDDDMHGDGGDDILLGGNGKDDIEGGSGNDVGTGGSGNDRMSLNSGNDTAIAEKNDGDDDYDGGEGLDTYDTSGTDADASIDLTGGTARSSDIGSDKVVAFENVNSGGGNDVITGTDTANTVNAGGGSDTVDFGAGDDVAVAQANDGNDHYDGGTGADSYDASATTADAVIDLAEETASSDDIGNDTVVAFENVSSGSGDDLITGTDMANVVCAGGGDDTVVLGAGDDVAVAQVNDGDDHYAGGAGSDTYDTSTTAANVSIDLVAGTASSSDTGHDTVSGFENVALGSGNDTVVCGDDDNTINSGSGNDTVSLGGGDDRVVASAGDGDDYYSGGSGNDTYDLSTTSADALIDLIAQSVTSVDVGHDIILNFENVSGGKGNDTIVANDARNIFIGGEGDDRFEFHSSASIGHGRGSRDQILDFSVGDHIDIDKVRDEFADNLSGTFSDKDIERFVILRDQDSVFSRPGELKIQYDNFDGHDVTIIQGNTDYDADAEFELELAGTFVMTDDDFYRA